MLGGQSALPRNAQPVINNPIAAIQLPANGPGAEAVAACFQRALTIARQQGAKALELRAATSLSRLWQAQGKPDTARTLLADVYSGFTEGFDTADLQAAKTLLETLEGAVPSARLLFGRHGSA